MPEGKLSGPAPSTVRLRAFILAVLIIPADNYWVIMMEKVRSGPYPTTISLFANAVFVLAALIALNALLRRIKPRWVFSSAELLLVYVMAAISTALAGHDMLPGLVGMMAYPYSTVTMETNSSSTFLPHLPRWLMITDPEALKALWEGNSNLYSTGFWNVWLKPTLWWLAFTLSLVWVMMCINTLVRKQWIERERLTFPIVQLPLAMTEPVGTIWRTRLFWIGFGISFGIVLLNGLSEYLPAIPSIHVGFEGRNLAAGLVSPPWNAMNATGGLPYSFYPFAIGIGYLLPADLCFSCWFFYLCWKLQSVVSAMFGIEVVPGGFPYVKHQAFGGLMAIVLTMAWTSRGYLRQVWKRAIGAKSDLDDKDEAISYLSAIAGALLGFAFLAWFMIQIGMSPLFAVAAFAIYFIIATALARIRAELGPPIHDFHFSGPDAMIMSSAGTGRMTNQDLVAFTYFFWFNRAYRAHPMPVSIEGVKIADARKASQRKFLIGIMLAIAVGTLATFWSYLDAGYRLGWASGVKQGGVYAHSGFRNLSVWWSRPENLQGPNWPTNGAMLVGFGFCMLLSYIRLNVVNIPFHPIGYAVSASFEIGLVWVPLLLAWTVKVALIKGGGLKLYRAALPFFLGLILGEMIMGCIWSIIGIGFGIPYYNFWGI